MRSPIGSLLARVFKPRPTESIAEWARTNIELGTKESLEFPGPYDPDLSPHATILFEVALDPAYDEFICRKSSQSAFTLHCLILACYWVVHFARNIIYTIDSRDEVRRISNERLQPMLRRCGAASGKIPENDDKMSALTLSLKGLVIYLAGANSVGSLANKSVGLAICDEVDAYQNRAARTEAHPVHLVRDRLKRVTDGFFVEISKPDQWEDQITQDFLTGTRHQCNVPCPRCGEMQDLFFGHGMDYEDRRGGVTFDHCRDASGRWDTERVLRETHYTCTHCGGRIDEHEKPAMLRLREYRRTNFGQDNWKPKPRRFSCEVSDLYSTFPTASWGVIACEFIDAQGDQDKLDHFLRNRLGKPVRKQTVKVEEDHILAMIGAYSRGHCPVPPDLVLMGVDKQKSEYKWVKVAYRFATDECWIVDYGSCRKESELVEEADRPVIVDDWGETPEEERENPTVLLGLVDEGYKRYEVRNFCLQTATGETDHNGMPQLRFYPTRGLQRQSHTMPDIVEEKTKHSQSGQPITSYYFSNDAFLTMLYEHAISGRSKIIEQREDGLVPLAPLLHLMKNPDASFVSELTQEQRRKVIRANRWVEEWDPDPPGDNDFGDALKYCFIEIYVLKPFLRAVAEANEAAEIDDGA